MKSRGTYTITNAEEGKAAQLDQSFRSCLMALLIFFFMCMIMLLTLLFAQKSGMSYTTTEKQTAMQLQDDANGGTELVIDDPDNEPSYNNYHPAPPKKTATTTESFQLPPTEPSSTETYTTSTEQSTLTSSAEYPLVDIEQTTSFHETSSPTSEFTTSRASDSTDKVQIFADTTENFESTSNEWQSSSTEIVTSTSYDDLTTDNSMWSSPQNYIELNNVDDCLLRCRGTDFGSTTPSDVPTDEKQVKKWNILEESMSPTVEKKEEETISDCNDGQCKRVASKILSYMDHEGSPCVDFYEYACGGLEADYQISEKDLSRRAYETVKRQAEQERNNPRYAQFIRYYDSCLNYEVTDSISERIRLVKKALEKIGKFYTQTEWGNRTEDFTEMFANMMKNNWPLLFDIVPDVNKKNPEIFTLTIGPRQLVFENKSLQFPHDSDPCENEKEEAMSLQRTIDLDIQYRKYEDCKTDTKRFVTSIRQTLSDLHIFDSLTNSGNISQNIELTINAIDIDIIEGIIKKYSSERQIYEDYRSKNYSIMQLSDLQGDRTLINWTQLIRSLTGSDLGNDASVYVYKKDELIEAMKKLEELGKTSPYNLNNALLGLYAHYLYNNFVTPKSPRDLHNDCLYKGVHLMKDLASEIYMRSFTDHEVEHMRNVVRVVSELLKKF